MTALMDRAIEVVRNLPPATQDDLAKFLLELASSPPTPLSSDEAAAIAEAEAEIARGERVPASTMEAFWKSHGV